MSSSLQKNNNRDNDIEEGDATVPSTTQANSMLTTTGPELIDADDEPPLPLPMGMAEAALDTAKDDPEREGPEHIDDNIGPDYSMDIEKVQQTKVSSSSSHFSMGNYAQHLRHHTSEHGSSYWTI